MTSTISIVTTLFTLTLSILILLHSILYPINVVVIRVIEAIIGGVIFTYSISKLNHILKTRR